MMKFPFISPAGVMIILAATVMVRGRPPAAATRSTASQESKPATALAGEQTSIVLPPAALLVWRGNGNSGR